MSSDLPVPRTAVPLGITDPVEKARAELKATLAAIEDKANVPRRASRAYGRAARKVRSFARQSPGGAAATVSAVVVGAALVGTVVWAVVRAYSR